MKKFKILLFITIAILLASLPFLNIGAATVERSITELVNSEYEITGSTLTITREISTLVQELLGENGGSLQVVVSTDAPENAVVSYTANFSPASTLSKEQANGPVSVIITFTIGNPDALTTLKVTSATLMATPATVLPTPDTSPTGSVEPSPSGSIEPSPSDSLEPSPSDMETPDSSPIVTDVITEPTPTKRPTVTPEPTKDNYTSNSQTQAPPTLSLPPDVTIGADLPTTAPENTPAPFEKVSDSPSLSFTIVLAVLILLLAVDLFLIYWRKQMGYGVLINNGISRRKVRDDLVDYPENTQSSDLDETLKNEDNE
ncbi:MAG: hypothetical protein E7365_02440 [Clostridiales bacterium]|nr:hypothetical protein [Clostridiales bacterium]